LFQKDRNNHEKNLKKLLELFAQFKKTHYFCTRFREERLTKKKQQKRRKSAEKQMEEISVKAG